MTLSLSWRGAVMLYDVFALLRLGLAFNCPWAVAWFVSSRIPNMVLLLRCSLRLSLAHLLGKQSLILSTCIHKVSVYCVIQTHSESCCTTDNSPCSEDLSLDYRNTVRCENVGCHGLQLHRVKLLQISMSILGLWSLLWDLFFIHPSHKRVQSFSRSCTTVLWTGDGANSLWELRIITTHPIKSWSLPSINIFFQVLSINNNNSLSRVKIIIKVWFNQII